MRWIPFVILVYLASALQLAGLGKLSDRSYPQPEFLVLVAVFYAMFATENGAMLAGLFCGVMIDLLNSTMLGTMAVPLAVICFLILKVRLSVFRERAISQGIMTAMAIVAFACVALALRWVLTIIVRAEGDSIVSWEFIGGKAMNAVYTGVLAPFLFWPLLRMEGAMGFGIRGSRGRH